MEGFEVEAASRGEDALERPSRRPPDASLLDLMMPGDGRPRDLRPAPAEPGSAPVPVVFLTARGRDDDDAPGRCGVVVQKPFDPE